MTRKGKERKLKENDLVINGVYRNVEDKKEYKLIRVTDDNEAILERVSDRKPLTIKIDDMFERIDPGSTENYSTMQSFKFKFIGYLAKPKNQTK